MNDRDRRSKFRADVWFDVWRSGGDPDAVDGDSIDDCFDTGACATECASEELRRQRRRNEDRAEELAQEEFRLREEEAAYYQSQREEEPDAY